MTKLKDNLKDSTLLLTGTIIPDKMEMLKGILQNNLSIFKKFDNIVLVLNTIDQKSKEYIEEYQQFFEDLLNEEKHHTKLYFLRDSINRGWQFGTIDMEKLGYQFVYDNLTSFIVLKLDFDIYLTENILELEIDDKYDVYYMPSVGYSTVDAEGIPKLMNDYDSNWPDYIKPQTICYLLNTPLHTFYPIEDWLNEKYKEWILHPIGNGPHHIGVACELLLMGTFEKNDCKIKMMISKQCFEKLLETIKAYNIHDPSHKNILFEEIGMCHLSDDKASIIKI